MKIKIESKSYFPIPTIINDSQAVIPPRGRILFRTVKSINNHLKALELKNYIKITEINE